MSDSERERLRTRLNALFEARQAAVELDDNPKNDPYLWGFGAGEIVKQLTAMVVKALEELRAHDARSVQMASDVVREMHKLFDNHRKQCPYCTVTRLCEVGENMTKAAALAEAYEATTAVRSEIEQEIRKLEGDQP